MEEILAALKGGLKFNKVEFLNGKVRLSGMYDAAGIDVELALSLEVNLFLDLVAKAIPGTIDDLVIGYLKGMLPSLLAK